MFFHLACDPNPLLPKNLSMDDGAIEYPAFTKDFVP